MNIRKLNEIFDSIQGVAQLDITDQSNTNVGGSEVGYFVGYYTNQAWQKIEQSW